jgi:hypothetical protein
VNFFLSVESGSPNIFWHFLSSLDFSLLLSFYQEKERRQG